MGPRQSLEGRSRQRQFFEKYEIIQQLQSENIRFLQHKQTKKQYLLRELNYTSKQEYLKGIQTIKNKKEQLKNSDHVVPLTQYFEKEEDQYCATFYKIYVLYEFPQRTLDDEINERNLKKNFFTETELWSILASCILGLSHLQKKGIKHESLKSTMIFLSQEGLIKISDPFTTGCQPNYQILINKRNTRHIYLSPEQCEALQSQLISPVTINSYKSDIFTLGMIILQCGLLQYQDECYRDEYSRIHIETLEYNKNKFRKVYSEQLANMLNYMLGEEANSRPQWIQLQNYVITDTGKSFISQARKSSIFPQSKPTSIQVKPKSIRFSGIEYPKITPNLSITNANGINSIVISPTNKKSSINEQKVTSNTSSISNRGIGLSFLKPLSVQNNSNHQIQSSNVRQQSSGAQNSMLNSQYQHLVRVVQVEPPLMKSNAQRNSSASTQFYQIPFQTSIPIGGSMHPQIQSNLHIVKPLSYKKQQGNRNQSKMKNFEIPPAKISNVSLTRPFKSIFPNPFYITKTKVDQNLIQVQVDNPDTQSASKVGHDNHMSSFLLAQTNKTQNKDEISYQSSQDANSLNQFPYNRIKYQQGANNIIPQPDNQKMPQIALNQTNKQNFSPYQNSSEQKSQFVVQTFKLGSRYEGYKLNGMRHGKGKFYYQDGGMYDGDWFKNKMEGYGRLYYQSGKIAYEGEWIQDQFTGKGILYNQNPQVLNNPFNYENFDDADQFWIKYQGQFEEDSKNGKGILYFSNGEYFEGNFINDAAQGEGIYTTIDGNKVRGFWESNALQRIF